jgi:Tol biopolymer transport system component
LGAFLAFFAAGCGGHGRAPGTIVFESGHSGREALYAVHPDGSGMTKLPLDIPSDGADVSWTRDGRKALVIYADSYVAYVYEPTSGIRRKIPLAGSYGVSDMPWSPDGKRLVLSTNKGNVVVLDVATGVRQPIDATEEDAPLAWSSDGKRLLFTVDRDVYAAPVDGRPAWLISRLARPEVVGLFEPQPSSDGKWIAFVADGVNQFVGLYAVRSDGADLHLIARDAHSFAWSPIGERLAFAGYKGVSLIDIANGRRRRLTNDRLDDPANEGPTWSPDGRRILYRRPDLGYGAVPGSHMQLWTMKVDGTDRHPLTRDFAPDLGDSAVWVDAELKGTRAPRLPVVAVPAARSITTSLPIVALAAEDNRAAVAQGFGGLPGLRGLLGPIVVWDQARETRVQVPVRGCGTADDVLLAAGRVGYVCGNPGEGYYTDDALRLVRPGRRGATQIVRTRGGEFTGLFLGGLVGDRGTIAFDVESAGNRPRAEFRIRRTRVWRLTGTRAKVVRTFTGVATVASIDAGRIAVLRDGGKAVALLSAGGGVRTFRFGGPGVVGVVLDGPRLIVLRSARLTVLDLRSGRRTGSWPVRRGFGPAAEIEDATRGLVAYVVGAAVHILRLSDGREIVIDNPNATEPVFARFVPSGLFYSFNKSYDRRPGRLVYVPRIELERAFTGRGTG